MSLIGYFQLAGLLMMVVAHLGMRAVPEGGSRRFPFYQAPWDNRGWFSPLGYWLQLVGWVLLVGGGLVKFVELMTQ